MHPLDTGTNSSTSAAAAAARWRNTHLGDLSFYQVVETELIIRMLKKKKIASHSQVNIFFHFDPYPVVNPFHLCFHIFPQSCSVPLDDFFTWIIPIRSFSFWSSESPGWWERSTGHCTASNHTRAIRLKSVINSRKEGNFLELGNFFLLSWTNFIFSKLSHSF